MRILLIEPDKLLGETYQRALESHGIEVSLASAAEQAIKALDSQADLPHVIVTELQLAGHNGVEFIYELRSYPEWNEIPIVLHTIVPSHSFELSERIRKSLGIQAYLYKPTTSLSKLIAQVERFAPTRT